MIGNPDPAELPAAYRRAAAELRRLLPAVPESAQQAMVAAALCLDHAAVQAEGMAAMAASASPATRARPSKTWTRKQKSCPGETLGHMAPTQGQPPGLPTPSNTSSP